MRTYIDHIKYYIISCLLANIEYHSNSYYDLILKIRLFCLI